VDILDTHDLRRLRVGFLGELIGMVRVLERSFGMPLSPFVVAFFMVFGGSSMGARRKFVLLGGLPVCVVHGFFYRCTATAVCGMSALASLDDAISCAPVCFNKSFARAIFSDVSQ
jgi:hypothetical protein